MKQVILLLALLFASTQSHGQREIKDRRLILGTGTDQDVTIEVSLGLPGSPKQRYNVTNDVWEFSHDGTTWQTMVGLGYVNTQLALKAPLASPALTGTPTAPTATQGNNSTQIATTAYVDLAATNATAPDATTLVKGKVQLAGDLSGTAASPTVPGLALKAPLASPALTGVPTAPTASQGNNSTQLATTAYVDLAATNVTVPDATTLVKGKVQLAGDLSGTAASPTVPGLALKAPLASPALTGTPTAPTASAGNNSTQLATTAYTDGAVSTLSGTTTSALALKAPLASPALTGTPTAPTQTALDNSTKIATTAYTDGAVSTLSGTTTSALALKANIASPTFTGTPSAPTPSANDNSTKLATTAYVDTADALNVQLAGPQTVTGAKTFSGRIDSTSTTFGNRPCPVMTDAQMLAIASPNNGDCVLNSTKKAPYYYESVSTTWKVMGGGAGGSRLNLMVDGSFEDAVTDGTCSGCTATQDSTNILLTANNTKALKLAFSASTGCYTVDKTTSAQYANVQGLVGAWIQNTNAGITFTSRRNGADTTNIKNVDSDGVYKYYEIPDITGSTSFGWKICATSSITGNIFADETFAGPSKVLGNDPTITAWAPYTPTITSFGTTPTSVEFEYRQVGQNIEIRGKFTAAATPAASEARVSLPNSLLSAGTSVIPSITLVGHAVGSASSTTYFSTEVLIEPSVGYVTFGQQSSTTHALTKMNGNAFAAGNTLSFFASVPVSGLQGSVTSYSQGCGAACENEFSARISSTGVVSGEGFDWLNGNCTVVGTAGYSCNFVSGIFTVAPNCNVTVENGASQPLTQMIDNTATTSSLVKFYTTQSATGAENARGSTLRCSKAGVDFVSSRVLKGTFNEVSVTPGLVRPVKYRARYNGATDTTVCSSSPCTTTEMYSQDWVNGNITRTGTGTYVFTSNAIYEANQWVFCEASRQGTAAFDGDGGGNFMLLANSSGVITGTFRGWNAAGTANDTFGFIQCDGGKL